MEFYHVEPIDEHTWRIEDCFRSYMYLLEGEKEAVLIDSGIGLPGLDKCVSGLTEKPVTVINSHGHLDHVGGNCQFEKRFMMEADYNAMKEHTDAGFRRKIIDGLAREFGMQPEESELEKIADAGYEVPFFPLADGQVFDLGKRSVEIIATPGHTRGSVCILDRERKNLFSADTVCDQGILLFFSHSASVSSFLQSIQILKQRKSEYEKMWPGHHKCPLDLSYLEEYQECAGEILAAPEKGEDIRSNLGEGKIWYRGRISITYQMHNL